MYYAIIFDLFDKFVSLKMASVSILAVPIKEMMMRVDIQAKGFKVTQDVMQHTRH